MEAYGGSENRGQQTLQKLIKEVRSKNLSPTHFLLIFFGFAIIKSSMRAKIRRLSFEKINEKDYSINISGDPDDKVNIKWKSHNQETSILYYSISRFDETYVRQLTKGLMKRVYEEIKDELKLTDEMFTMSFLTSKNLDFNIDLVSGSAESIGNVMPGTPRPELLNDDDE